MSDELLRAVAINGSALSDVKVINPRTGKESALYTGQCARLLLSMCHHANINRVVFVGQHTFQDETGLNGQSIGTFTKHLLDVGYLIFLGTKSYKGSRPVNNYYVNLPFLEPLDGLDLDSLLATPVSDRLAMFSKEALKGSLGISLTAPLQARDKQEQELKTNKCKRKQEQEADIDYTLEDEPSIEDVEEMMQMMTDRFSDEDF
jgi:hypothetical protein